MRYELTVCVNGVIKHYSFEDSKTRTRFINLMIKTGLDFEYETMDVSPKVRVL